MFAERLWISTYSVPGISGWYMISLITTFPSAGSPPPVTVTVIVSDWPAIGSPGRSIPLTAIVCTPGSSANDSRQVFSLVHSNGWVFPSTRRRYTASEAVPSSSTSDCPVAKSAPPLVVIAKPLSKAASWPSTKARRWSIQSGIDRFEDPLGTFGEVSGTPAACKAAHLASRTGATLEPRKNESTASRSACQ